MLEPVYTKLDVTIATATGCKPSGMDQLPVGGKAIIACKDAKGVVKDYEVPVDSYKKSLQAVRELRFLLVRLGPWLLLSVPDKSEALLPPGSPTSL